jgi:hypothetical protein
MLPDRGGVTRPAGRPGQQRGDRLRHVAAQDRRRPGRRPSGVRDEPVRRLAVLPARRSSDGAQCVGPHRQRLERGRLACLDGGRDARLLDLEGGAERPHPGTRCRAAGQRDPGERRLPRMEPDRNGWPGRAASRGRGPVRVVWAALLDDAGPTGRFFRDGRQLPW